MIVAQSRFHTYNSEFETNLVYIMKVYKNRPSKVSTNFLDQLSKILSFSPSKTKRETIKQKRSQRR